MLFPGEIKPLIERRVIEGIVQAAQLYARRRVRYLIKVTPKRRHPHRVRNLHERAQNCADQDHGVRRNRISQMKAFIALHLSDCGG
jgi:hypothetical protein